MNGRRDWKRILFGRPGDRALVEWYTVGMLICILAFGIALSELNIGAAIFFAGVVALAGMMIRRATR